MHSDSQAVRVESEAPRGRAERKVLKRFVAYLEKERNATAATVKAYGDDTLKFIEFLESRHGRGMLPGDVTEAMVRELLTFLVEKGYKKRNSASSRGRRLSTIRSFFKYAYCVGLIRNGPAVMISTSRGRGSEPSFLTVEEYKSLLQVIEKGSSEFFRLRDYSVVSMILSTGARISELTNADVGDLSLKNKTVKLHRKGGEQQTLPLSESLLSSLRRYMRVRRRRTRSRAGTIGCSGKNRPFRGRRPSQFDDMTNASPIIALEQPTVKTCIHDLPMERKLLRRATRRRLPRISSHEGQPASTLLLQFCIRSCEGKLIPIEVRLSGTVRQDMAAGVKEFQRDLGDQAGLGYVVHPGDVRLPLGPNVTALPIAEL